MVGDFRRARTKLNTISGLGEEVEEVEVVEDWVFSWTTDWNGNVRRCISSTGPLW